MAREVLRTKTFASDAANFILTRARESIDERQPISDRAFRREYAALGLCGDGQTRFTVGKISFYLW